MRRVQIWPVATYLAGLALFYIAERLFPASMAARVALDAVAGLLVLAAVGKRLMERSAAEDDLRAVLGPVLVFMAGGLVAVALHWLAAEPVVGALGLDDEGAHRFKVVVHCLWPIALAATVIPLGFMEVSLQSSASAPVLEVARIHRSAEAGLVIALALSLLFAVNFLAHEHNVREDLSYSKTTAPGSATLLLVESLTEPLQIVLFFPAANDVKEEVEPYFDALAATNERVTLQVADHDAEPALAKELKAQKNGTVVLSMGENAESYQLGTDIDKAKSKLRKLDKEVYKRLVEVAKPALKAYLTTGHGERSWTKSDLDPRPGIKDLKTLMQVFGYSLAQIGMNDLLSEGVPGDATVVMIIGPTEELLPGEIVKLQEFLDGGGDLWIFLDPEQEVFLEGLLAPMGVAFHNETLAHDGNFYPVSGNPSDHQWLISDRFGSHPSVKVLQKASKANGVLLVGAGHLETLDGVEGVEPTVAVKSQPRTWADLDGDFAFSRDAESRKVYDVCLAVEREVTDPDTDEAAESRVMILADSDAVSDRPIQGDRKVTPMRVVGNSNLIGGSLAWLKGEEDLAGEITNEEDKPIQHTRKKDVWWLYSTTFGIPLAVMGVGLLVSLRRRRRVQR